MCVSCFTSNSVAGGMRCVCVEGSGGGVEYWMRRLELGAVLGVT